MPFFSSLRGLLITGVRDSPRRHKIIADVRRKMLGRISTVEPELDLVTVQRKGTSKGRKFMT
jgi:hypothetical protein